MFFYNTTKFFKNSTLNIKLKNHSIVRDYKLVIIFDNPTQCCGILKYLIFI
jgi:hypothetical protein